MKFIQSEQCLCCDSRDIKSSPAVLMPFVSHRIFGYAPFFISISFLIGVILISIGLVGEYIISIHRRLKQLPLVIEKERINM